MISQIVMTALLAGAAPGPDMSSIEVPFEAMPHFLAYSDCVTEAFKANPKRNGTAEEVGESDASAREKCAEVRKVELKKATDTIRKNGKCIWPDRPTLQRCLELTETAFQRLDHDFEIVPNSAGAEAQ